MESSLYDWQCPWLESPHLRKITPSSNALHYFSTATKPGYRKVKCSVNSDNTKPLTMNLFYKIREDRPPIKAKREEEEKQEVQADLSYLDTILQERKQVQFATDLISKSIWVEKYSPKRYIDLLSDERHNRLVLNWAKKWDRMVFKTSQNLVKPLTLGKFLSRVRVDMEEENKQESSNHKEEALDEQRLILLAGPAGCGKTTLARIVAQHCGYSYMQINASDNRSARNIIKRIDDMSSIQSMSQKPTFIIIDEVDGILDSEANGIKEILNYIETGDIPGQEGSKKSKVKNSKDKSLHIKRPLIFICNDPFVRGLKELRRKSYTLYMQKIRTENIVDKLKQISDAEGIHIEADTLERVATLNDNDIRGSLAMLEFITKHKDFKKKPARQIIDGIQWEAKDLVKSPVDFVEKLMLNMHINKGLDYAGLTRRLYDIDDSADVVLMTLFSNLHNSKTVLRHSSKIPELLELMANSDVLIARSFGNEASMKPHFAIPYYYFKMFFKPEDNQTRVEFPIAFFEGITKQREHKKRLKTLWQGLHDSLKPYNTLTQLNEYTLVPLFTCIQTKSNAQVDLVKCIKLMISYGISFGNFEDEIYEPPLEAMITISKRRPEVILTKIARILMKSNFKTLKEMVESSSRHDSLDPVWKISESLKKKKFNSAEGIEYKYCEGTGTEIRYVLKMGYFK